MVDGKAFRTIIGRFASGVTVLTTSADGADWGMTASALCSLSLDPPMVVICINKAAPTGEAIASSGHLAVNIMSADQGWVAARFATPVADKFAGVAFTRGTAHGDPLLEDSLATLECEVAEVVHGGTHRIFLACVIAAQDTDRDPLAYYRGQFGRFEVVEHSEAYRALLRKVIAREFPLEEPLDPIRIAEATGMTRAAVYYALSRLLADGLVTHDPARGYRQVLFDARKAIESHEVKRLLDMAVADDTVGKISPPDVQRLRQLADAANELVADEGIVEVDLYRARTLIFQEAMIGLAGNDTLLTILRTLRTPELISLPEQTAAGVARQIAANRQRIVEGYEAADLDVTKRALNEQADLLISLCMAHIERGGGAM